MGNASLEISIPLDKDGFVEMECDFCKNRFMLLLLTWLIYRKMSGKEAKKVNWKAVGKTIYGIFAALVFGAGMRIDWLGMINVCFLCYNKYNKLESALL